MAELRLDLSKIDKDLESQYDDPEGGEDCVDDIDPLSDDLSPDDRLSPLDKLQKYFQSDDVEERDIALRIIPDAVASITSFSEFDLLLDVVFALATDYEPCIRINVLANLSPLLDKNTSLSSENMEFAAENEDRLYSIAVKMLVDINLQVRRASQNCVVSLLEEDRSSKGSLLSQLCPMIKRCLGKDENYDLRMDTVLVLGRVASIIGHETIVENFVSLLPSLALDTMFHVRKAFVMSCRDLSPVLGEDDTEKHLLPLFFKLCKDEVWGVRKACADVFTDVSASCNLGTRHDKLTPVYLNLLHDDSRWVRKAAFQSLGAFISSFHVPNGTISPDLDQLPPLIDSFLTDPSLLGKAELTTSSQESTTDPAVENRHAPINEDPLKPDFNSNTNLDSNTGSEVDSKPNSDSNSGTEPVTQSNSNTKAELNGTEEVEEIKSNPSSSSQDTNNELNDEETTAELDNSGGFDPNLRDNEEIKFVTSEITRTSSDESLEKTLEDLTLDTPASHDDSRELENDILDRAIKKIDTVQSGGLDEPLDLHQASVSGEGGMKSKHNIDGSDEPTEPSPPCSESSPVPSRLTELLMEDTSRLRSSSEGSSFRSYFDPVVRDDSNQRRWSLDKNNGASQVRVFIHSASGKVVEQDLSVVDQEPLTPDTPSDTPYSFELPHNSTTTHSVPMELTMDQSQTDPSMGLDVPGQEVVPDELMESYLSMTEQATAQGVDMDLPYYCAYSLPGVALTLGLEHWDLIKPTFSLLASDMQWRIRRVLSFSLHELAKVVGEEKMMLDIMPVFEEYCTKDIDDVKIGALSHLAEFFELLPTGLRSRHLPGVLHGVQDVENEKNWRYRNLLAEQLVLLCDLFDIDYLEQHVYPVAVTLAEDKVSEVRTTATIALGVMLEKLAITNMEKCRGILRQLKQYGSNDKWLHRLMYVKQCEGFLLERRVSCELFATECLPILLQLARDKVPNVRIAVAKMLKESVLKIDYFQTDNRETFSLEELQITLECLQHDQDRDVKFFAGGEVSDSRRLMKLPVHLHTQRQRAESSVSQTSEVDQYQDALEIQPLSLGTPTDTPPLSLSMAGALASSLVNHQIPPDPSTVGEAFEEETSLNEHTQEDKGPVEGNSEPSLTITDIEESETLSESENTLGTEIRDNTQTDIRTDISQDTTQDIVGSQDTTQDIVDSQDTNRDITELNTQDKIKEN